MRPNRHGRSARAIAYLRVSTDKQADSGLGLEAQHTAVVACAARLGLSLAAIHTDAGTSGALSIEDRPVLLEAVNALRRGDTLVVAKRDRLGRDLISTAITERLVIRRGARIVSAAGEGSDGAPDDPSSQLFRRLIDSFAEHERLIIGARTKAALAAKRLRQERVSRHPPFGFAVTSDGRRLEPQAAEQAILGFMRARRLEGASCQTIAVELNARGQFTRAGSLWRYQYVWSALRPR